ncbi:MAG: hypothetical protein LUG16_03215 [Candidatus Gastranaerophilales bacterium]|nr:hypothetical protein [Candidatus Gastranaerophilales bacterium]
MNIQKTQTNPKSHSVVVDAYAGGLVAAGLQRIFLPAESKDALKIARVKEDAFVKTAVENAKNIAKTQAENKAGESAFKIKTTLYEPNLEQIAENSKNLFNSMKEKAIPIKKNLAKTFFATAAAIAIGEIALNAFAKKSANQRVNEK